MQWLDWVLVICLPVAISVATFIYSRKDANRAAQQSDLDFLQQSLREAKEEIRELQKRESEIERRWNEHRERCEKQICALEQQKENLTRENLILMRKILLNENGGHPPKVQT